MLFNQNKGIGLVEVVIGAAIILTGITALIGSFLIYTQYALGNDKNAQAAYVLEEGLEAISFLRDSGWTANISNLSTATTYYLSWNGTRWVTTTVPQYVDGVFLRKINLDTVSRDANDRIAASGTNDPNSRKITATVEYFQGHATTTKTISTYLSNIYGN